MTEPSKFVICEGGVQCYVARSSPHYMRHFGRPEYDIHKPILSESLKEQAQPIVDALNAGTMTIEDAEKKLDRISW